MNLADAVDAALEFPIVPSFSRIGPAVRSRLEHWTTLPARGLDGRVVVVTGGTSGLGRAAAGYLVGAGATVELLGRDDARLTAAADEVAALVHDPHVGTVTADMGDVDDVRRAAETLRRRHRRIDVLIHNAGALTADRCTSRDGLEQTVASQVRGPFLLTALLLDLVTAAAPGRVLTMSSGGMYAADLTVGRLQMGPDDYRGAEQYARAKRAQVTLNEMWAQRVGRREAVFHAVHPGWADTPGVASSLPTFRRVVGPLLRTPEQGADTVEWLAVDDGEPLRRTGLFWLDRRPRPLHRLPTTRRSDTPQRRIRLWEWCVAAAGLDPAVLPPAPG